MSKKKIDDEETMGTAPVTDEDAESGTAAASGSGSGASGGAENEGNDGAGIAEEPLLPPMPDAWVYCGPSIRGVARQYTVYSGGIPDALRDAVEEKYFGLHNLIVPIEQFAQMRKALNTEGTAEAILYKKIKSEL